MSEPTVFLIDDDEAVLASLSLLLEISGMKTKSFHSAENFLDEITDQTTGCVITDLKLAGMSGVQLQEHLSSINRRLPIVVITGQIDTRVKTAMIEKGAIAVLSKPYDPRQLLDLTRQALQGNSRLQQQQSHRPGI